MNKPEITSLNEFLHARIRTEMYLGSRDPNTQSIMCYENSNPIVRDITWVPALFTAYREIVDNAIDEIIEHGFGDSLDIAYNEETLTFKIKDNGRGIPISVHPETGMYQATMALSQTKSGRNFDDATRGATRGVNGVGASIVNFCSEWFQVDITRDKTTFSQTFGEGKEDLITKDPLILKTKNTATGTTIEFKLSKQVFKHYELPMKFIEDRVLELSLCYPELKITLNGKKIKSLPVEKSIFKGRKPIFFEINEEGFKSRFWLCHSFTEQNNEHAHSLVNGIPVFDGGTHIDAFKRNFYSGLLKALEPMSKRKKLKPNRSDVSEGLLLFNITEMVQPSFGSQSKTRLINAPVEKIVTKHLSDIEFFKNVIKRNGEWIETIFERCALRTKKSDESDLARAARKAKKTKVDKLVDATGTDRSRSVLLLAEGDCLDENTEILRIKDSRCENTPLRDIRVGDIVVSHTNSLNKVNTITNKVEIVYKISTDYGDIKSTLKHRLLCHNRDEDTFSWIRVSDIDKNKHRLVRSKLADLSDNIDFIILDIDDPEYDREIRYVDPLTNELMYQLVTNNHCFGIFNKMSLTFEKIEAKYLNGDFHSLLLSEIVNTEEKL